MMLRSMYIIKPGRWDQHPEFSVYYERGGAGKPAKNLLTPPPGKKFSLLPGKILPVDSPSNQTPIFFFDKQVSQNLWTGTGMFKNSTGDELLLWIEGLGQSPNSQENLKIWRYCLFWQILQIRFKKYSFEASSSWCNIYGFFWGCFIK